jgi:hypothetical protein
MVHALLRFPSTGVMSCTLSDSYHRFGDTCWPHFQVPILFLPQGKGFSDVDNHLPNNTVSHSKTRVLKHIAVIVNTYRSKSCKNKCRLRVKYPCKETEFYERINNNVLTVGHLTYTKKLTLPTVRNIYLL